MLRDLLAYLYDRDVEIAGDGLTPSVSTAAVIKRAAIPSN